MMSPFIQIVYGVAGAVVVAFVLISSPFGLWQSGFGEVRHTLSIIGAIAILIASGYILRTRLFRWGSRQTWLKFHQRLASFGLCLVVIHSAVRPLAWHSWLTFTLALLNLGTGIAVSLTARRARRILLRVHLALAPILMVGIIIHGRGKLDHDKFFPLTQVHDVPCVRCHTADSLLFRFDAGLQKAFDKEDKLPEDVRWEFDIRGIPISEDTGISRKKKDGQWLIIDPKNGRRYFVRKEGGELNIYTDVSYRTYTCRTCHVHNTPEIQLAHEVHGVSLYNRCLDCHQTMFNDKRYGNQKVDWDYDPNW